MTNKRNRILTLMAITILALAITGTAAGNYDDMELVANTTSDANGNFSFTDVPNGEYRLASVIHSSAMGGMWLTNVSEFTIVNGTSVDITFAMRKNDSNDHNAILSYLDRTTVSGRTVSKTGSAKVGTDLVLTDQTGNFVANTTSNDTGHYLFTNVTNGDYRLSGVIHSSAMGGMWLTNVSEFTIVNGTPVNVAFAMRKNDSNDHNAILSYLDRTTVSGRTVSKTGSAKVGTDLVLTDRTGNFVANTTSNATGDYVFSTIPNGDYRLSGVIHSSAMGGMWLTNVSEFTIVNGTPVNVTFAMRKNDSNDHNAILSYLDRTTVSGLTVSKTGSAKVGTDLVLLKRIVADEGTEPEEPEEPEEPTVTTIFQFFGNATSNDTGHYVFNNVPNGDYRLSGVIHSSAMGGMWLTNVSDFSIENGTPVNVTFAMRKNDSNDHNAILSYLDRTTVSGRTVSKTGSAKVGTDLVLTDRNGEFVADTTSNDTGHYLFTNVTNGDYRLSGVIHSSAMGGMWLTNVSEFTIVNGTPVNVAFAMRKNDSNDHNAILSYLDRTTVSGRTVSKTGSAKVGTDLVLTDLNGEFVANTTSNATGDYVFSTIPNGDYRLSCVIHSSAMGGMWLTNVSEFTIVNGTPVNVAFAMRKNDSNDHNAILSYLDRTTVSGLTVSKTGSAKVGTDLVLLKRIVADEATEPEEPEEPEEPTVTIIFQFFGNATSNDTGHYVFNNVPNGDYRLSGVIHSSAMGGMWLTNVSEFTIENGTPVNIAFAMRKNDSNDHNAILAYLDRTTVSGRTVSKTGSAKVGTDLVLTDQNGEFVANTTSNATGDYVFSTIPNGDYRLSGVIHSSAMGGMWLTNVSEFTIENGTPVNVAFAMRKNDSNDHNAILAYLDRTTVSGRTVSKTGSAKVGTDLVLTDQNGEFVANTTSNATGDYVFSTIPNGDYRLSGVIHSSAMGGMWLTNVSEFTIENGTPVNVTFAMRKNDSNDHNAILSYLDRTTVLGLTVSKTGSAKVGTDLVLLKKVYVAVEEVTYSMPTANFSVNTTCGDCPLTVKFSDLSEGATSWCWDFGDGTNSTDQNPVHTYDSVGFFDVKLTVSNPEGSDLARKINLITSNLPGVNRTRQILFLVIGAEETSMAKQAVKDMGMDDWVDVYGSNRENRVEILYTPFDGNISMGKYDIVFISWKGSMSFLGANLKPQIQELINETNPGTFVYDWNYDLEDFPGINYVSHTEHQYLEDCWLKQYDNNIVRLITYLSVVDLSEPFANYTGAIRIEEPSIPPTNGIVHPDSGYEIFEDLESYLGWYSDDDGTHHVYNPENHTVGVVFFAGHDGDLCDGVAEALIVKLESRGINVIPAFRPGIIYDVDDAEDFFKAGDEYKVNAFIDIGMGVSSMSSSVWHTEALQAMNVPVINGIQYQGTIEEWEESVSGQDGRFQYQIPIMEIGGEIESIVIGATKYDVELGAWSFQPIDYQMDWLINRTVGWMDLRRIENQDKKVAIIYYNHGKQGAMVAANLDVVPSIPNFIDAMNESGYDLDGVNLNRSEFLELVLQQGRNIGVWAPGELEQMVENYDVELLPVETYLGWFEELEPAACQSVIDTWGEAPGKGMVYENESGQYFVFPKIEVGNILIAPQPPRGLTTSEAMLYHDQSVPPSHNYIAFYLWLNHEQGEGGLDMDAVVHFGRHGTQEWLQGKGVGLSAKECWPAILIQDMPVVYLYDVGGVGEGITAKRRGNAVMVDHLTAPVINSGLYGNLTRLHDAMHNYAVAEGSLKQEYKKSIIEYYEDLNFEHELGNSSEDLYAMENETFDNFILYGPVHDYLHEIAASYMTYGFHILGEDMSDEGLLAMVKSMLGNDFVRHVIATGICEDPDDLNPAHSPNVLDNLLEDVLVNETDPMDVVIDRFNIDYSSGQYYANVTSNASGEYSFSFVKEGKYTVYALKDEHDGWLTGKEYVTVENGESISGIHLNLTKNATGTTNPELESVLDLLKANPPVELPGSVEIFGQSYYSPMGYPIFKEGMKILLQQDGTVIEVQLSNVTGNYTFTGVPDGEYDITALYRSRSGNWYLKTESIEINATRSNKVNIDFGMNKDNDAGAVVSSLLGEVLGACSNESQGAEPDCNVVLIRRMSDAQLTVVNDLYNAIDFAGGIRECTNAEVESMIDALEGKYIPPALGDDPTRSPDEVLPTGKNFYAFNPNIVPTKESWEMGKQLAYEFLNDWTATYGGYPEKVGFVLWSSESMRHKGVMESEVLYLLGVEPVWGSSGKVEGVKLTPEDELGRPRIDVVVTTTGVYRDNWKWQIQLMDRAVRLAAQAENVTYANYVREHCDTIYAALLDTGNYTPSDARDLSMCRVFAPDDGSWGIGGLTNAVDASGSWDDEEKLANLYTNSMGYAYGDNIWAFEDTNVFTNALAGTEAIFFSRSGNSGRGSSSVIFDHTYEFFGGFGMAVRHVSGETPEMFIVNLKDPNQAVTETLGKFLARELRSTYWNQEYIKGMMEHGYTGASELGSIFEDFWGLKVMLPDAVTADMWNEMYEVYIGDKYDLGLDEWFDNENPWAHQSITAKILEATRKSDGEGNLYWDASDEIIRNLVKEYVESVAENGAACCHHTCGNPSLDDYVSGIISALDSDVVSADIAAKYRETIDAVTGREGVSLQPASTDTGSSSGDSNGGGDGTYPPNWFDETKQPEPQAQSRSDANETTVAGGIGEDITKPVQSSQDANPSEDYVEGQTMEVTEAFQTTPSSSSAPLFAIIAVIAILSLIAIGLRFKRR